MPIARLSCTKPIARRTYTLASHDSSIERFSLASGPAFSSAHSHLDTVDELDGVGFGRALQGDVVRRTPLLKENQRALTCSVRTSATSRRYSGDPHQRRGRQDTTVCFDRTNALSFLKFNSSQLLFHLYLSTFFSLWNKYFQFCTILFFTLLSSIFT
jgi:hypothetical protein